MSTPAPRSGVGDPGPLAAQDAAAVSAQDIRVLWATTGEHGIQPAQDRAVLAERVGDEAR